MCALPRKRTFTDTASMSRRVPATDTGQALPTAHTSAGRMPHRGGRIVLATASASISFSRDLVNSSGRGATGLRDTTLSTGRAQAAKSDGFRFGTDTILGFAVGGLRPRFRPMRSNLAHTALRLCPRRLAICPALWPSAQSFLRSATLAASHMVYCLTPKVQVLTISSRCPNFRDTLLVDFACQCRRP